MKQSIGSFAKATIANNSNKSNQELLDIVLQEFPNAKTSLSCIAWYKSDMKKHGYKVATQVERSISVIENELESAKLQVELLQEELANKKVATREQLEQQLEAIKKQLEMQE